MRTGREYVVPIVPIGNVSSKVAEICGDRIPTFFPVLTLSLPFLSLFFSSVFLYQRIFIILKVRADHKILPSPLTELKM